MNLNFCVSSEPYSSKIVFSRFHLGISINLFRSCGTLRAILWIERYLFHSLASDVPSNIVDTRLYCPAWRSFISNFVLMTVIMILCLRVPMSEWDLWSVQISTLIRAVKCCMFDLILYNKNVSVFNYWSIILLLNKNYNWRVYIYSYRQVPCEFIHSHYANFGLLWHQSTWRFYLP